MATHCYHAPLRLPDGDVDDGTTTAKDAHAAATPPCIDGDTLDYVVSRGDFKDMGLERVWAFTGDDYGGLGFVFGPWRPAA